LPLVYIISDSTGDLGSRSVKAVLEQFEDVEIEEQRFLNIRTEKMVEDAMRSAKENRPVIIIYTLVKPTLRKLVQKRAHEHGIRAFGLLMDDLVPAFAEVLNQAPLEKPGRRIDEDYYEEKHQESDALEFARDHDDGNRLNELRAANVVIVGVSRVSKTPVCTHLALKGLFAANIPIVLEVDPPKELDNVDPDRVFVLKVTPERLRKIREVRDEHMTQGAHVINYAEMDHIVKELAKVNRLAQQKKWTVIDVTNRAVEETAELIRQYYKKRFQRVAAE
jgi:regulator of PEP synthase PpsR (kinase-PPPase family)